MSYSLVPDRCFSDYTELTVPLLQTENVRLILSDLDYTLAPKSVPEANETLQTWLHTLQDSGIAVCILSNNRNPQRVERFCAPLGIPYIGHAGKPSSRAYRAAMQRCGVTAAQTVMLGDKLLTDCLGAHRAGLRAWIVEPLGGANTAWQRVLHGLQQPFKNAAGK